MCSEYIDELAGLANIIQKVEVDLQLQRLDDKSLAGSVNTVCYNLVFNDDDAATMTTLLKDSPLKDYTPSGLEAILDGAEVDQNMDSYVDESSLQIDVSSDSVVCPDICMELCENNCDQTLPHVPFQDQAV